MSEFPLILASGGFPVLGIVFLIIWALSAMASINKKKQQRPRRDRERSEFFPEMQSPPPAPPQPRAWPYRDEPRAQQPQPVRPPLNVRTTRPPVAARPTPPQPKAKAPARPAAAAAELPLAPLGGGGMAGEIAHTEIGSVAHNAGNERSERARRLHTLLAPRSARYAILLSEVLAPPLALRAPRE